MEKILIGQYIKKYREINKLTRNQLAEKIGISPSALANYENNNRVPSVDILIKLSDILNVSVDLLCGKTNIYNELNHCKNEIEYYKKQVTILEEALNENLTFDYSNNTLSTNDLEDYSLIISSIQDLFNKGFFNTPNYTTVSINNLCEALTKIQNLQGDLIDTLSDKLKNNTDK